MEHINLLESKTDDVNTEVKVLAKGAGISMFAKFGARGLQLVLQIFLARYLGPVGFGLFVIGQTILQTSAQFGSLGLPYSVIRFGVSALQESPQRLKAVLQNAFFLCFLSGLIFGGIGYAISPWLAINIYKQPELISIFRGFAIASAISIWLYVVSSATQITKRMEYSALSLDLMPILVNLVLVVVLIYSIGISITSAVFAVICGNIIGWGISIYFTQRLFHPTLEIGHFSLPMIRNLITFALPNLFAGVLSVWLQNVTILILGYFIPPDQVGIFQAARQIAMFPAIVLLAFNLIFSPIIADLYAKREMQKMNQLFIVITKWGLYLSVPIVLVAVFMSEKIMTVIYGNAFATGAATLVILMLSELINMATGTVGVILTFTHHQNRLLLYCCIAFVVCVLLNLWLIPMLGILGAALALGMSIATLNLMALWSVRHLLGLWPYDRRYYKLFIALVVSAPIVYLGNKIIIHPSFWNLAGISLVTVIIFAGVLLALGLEDYERMLFELLKGQFLGKVTGSHPKNS